MVTCGLNDYGQREEVPSTILETLDRDWTASALAAEEKCQSYPAGPYSQEVAKLQQKKIVFSHLISSKKKGISFEHAICHLREYRTLVRKIKELEREVLGLLHKKELQFQMELKLMAGDKDGAKGIRKILKAEETREMQQTETTAPIIAKNATHRRH
jgi:hypothetical protein